MNSKPWRAWPYAVIGILTGLGAGQFVKDHEQDKRINALESQIAELRAASRANVLRALPEAKEQKLTVTLPVALPILTPSQSRPDPSASQFSSPNP